MKHAKKAGNTGGQGQKGDAPEVTIGNKGIQGIQGDRGSAGVAGPKGNDGTSVTIKDYYATLVALQAAHPTGSEGDGYLVGDQLCVWLPGEGWKLVGPIQGPVTCVVIFDPDGSYKADGVTFASFTMKAVIKNDVIRLPATTIIKPHYTFGGWFVVDDNDDMTSEEWNLNTTTVTESKNLRAKWESALINIENGSGTGTPNHWHPHSTQRQLVAGT